MTNPDILEALVERLNNFTTCGCGDDDWPQLRHDVVKALDATPSPQWQDIATAPKDGGKRKRKITCPHCNGVGDIDDGDHPCGLCGGSGKIKAPKFNDHGSRNERETIVSFIRAFEFGGGPIAHGMASFATRLAKQIEAGDHLPPPSTGGGS